MLNDFFFLQNIPLYTCVKFGIMFKNRANIKTASVELYICQIEYATYMNSTNAVLFSPLNVFSCSRYKPTKWNVRSTRAEFPSQIAFFSAAI